MPSPVLSKLCANDAALGAADVRELVIRACPARDYLNKKVLLIVPDATRTAPVDLCFKALHEQLAEGTAAFDVMVALGTHQAMTEKAICDRLGISLAQRRERYFLKQWDKFKDYPWGTLAHSTHVRGIGKFENGVEHCRAKVTLATRIPREICEKINLGYRDPDSIELEEFANREDEGVLLVRKAGEMLYQLRKTCCVGAWRSLKPRGHCGPDLKSRKI